MLARIGAAAKAGGVVVVGGGMRNGAVLAAFAVDAGVEVVATAERTIGIGRPLVDVANHVIDMKPVRAAGERPCRSERARNLVEARIVHGLAQVTPRAEPEEKSIERGHAMRVDAIAVLAFIAVRVFGCRRTLTSRDPLAVGAQPFARFFAGPLGLVATDVRLWDDALPGDRPHPNAGHRQKRRVGRGRSVVANLLRARLESVDAELADEL